MTKARSNATANAAKGDLTVGNGTNLSGVLGVGSNGETIVADSSTSTGLRYTAGTVQSNPVLNSAFQVWQRGTSIAGQQAYTADRWFKLRGSDAAGQTVSRQTTSDTTNLPSIQYCARVQRAAANTSTEPLLFWNNFESVNSIPFAGKTITLSFYARAGANYSSASSALTVLLYTGTGTDQATPYAYTGAATPINSTATLTTTWQRFTYTATVAATVTQMAPQFNYTPVGTPGANDWYEVTGVQIDIGSVALPFRTYAGTIQGELAACQRYFYRYNAAATTGPLGVGSYYGSTTLVLPIQMKQTMRTAPSATFNNPTNFTAYSNGAARAATGMSLDIANTDVYSVTITTSAATAGNAASVNAVQTNASIDFSSEL